MLSLLCYRFGSRAKEIYKKIDGLTAGDLSETQGPVAPKQRLARCRKSAR